MSYTELYKFDKNGEAKLFAEIRNAWRGAIRIWSILDEKYLPPFKPYWETNPSNKHSRVADLGEGAMKDIWGLIENKDVSETDKIVLGSTFDNVVVMKEDLPKLKYINN